MTEILEVAEIQGYEVATVPLSSLARTHSEWGLLGAVTTDPTNLTMSQELLEQLANALNQRLMDYHKDRRYLQTFFAPVHVSRLLSIGDYPAHYLVPQLQDVAMLYTDINSFTKISEQILDTPQEVGDLVNFWSGGVVEILHRYGGVFDKMVGDCIIGLFGPPFNEVSPAEKVAAAIESALAINAYTRDLTGSDVVDKVRRSSLIPGLGVATGIHYGSVMVGQFGPNHDFTAFGREMNNTARLQGVAGFREVLVMETAYGVLAMAKHPLVQRLSWSDRREATVKNVRDPLPYRSIVMS
ncbi:MAG: adenylate/guanylate cyclase domain-containing protein [Prochlorothrix sp.]